MIIADTHVHVYPQFDCERLLLSATINFKKIADSKHQASPHTRILFLTERHDCNFFLDLARKDLSIPSLWSLVELAHGRVIEITLPSGDSFIIVAGRQVVTAERLEVLCLGTDTRIGDGQPIDTVVNAALAENAVPVIPWSPGKWLGKRGKIIENILKTDLAKSIALADSALRPWGYPFPTLLSQAVSKGIPVLAGTDPLPLPAEEQRVGSYVCMWDREMNRENIFHTLHSLLFRPCDRMGKRLSPFSLGSKLWKLSQGASQNPDAPAPSRVAP